MGTNDFLEAAKALLAWLWAYPGAKVLISLIGLNTATAIAAAIRNSQFSFTEAFGFLQKDVLPKVVIYSAAELFGAAIDFTWIGPTVLSGLVIELGARLLSNLGALGVKQPDTMRRLTRRVK